MNTVQLVGNLTKNVDYGETTTGVPYAQFTLAVQRRFSNANGERQTDFIDCLAWRNTAELCNKYLSKGSKIGVIGSIQVDTYTDRDGKTRKSFKVVISELEFLSSNTNNSSSKGARRQQNHQEALEEYDDGDTLPF